MIKFYEFIQTIPIDTKLTIYYYTKYGDTICVRKMVSELRDEVLPECKPLFTTNIKHIDVDGFKELTLIIE